LYRQVSRFLAPEDAIDVAGGFPELIDDGKDYVRERLGLPGVALIACVGPTMSSVYPSAGARTTVSVDFIAYAKANPRKLNMASGGERLRLTCELFKVRRCFQRDRMVHIPVRQTQLPVLEQLERFS
jgi:hypothetical protein